MTDEHPTASESISPQPRWQPLGAIDRRVIGVLAEKAKTTPDAYPMSLNAIVTGCNQRSNRAPLMQLEADDVQQSLDRLRESGALGMIEGYGRVAKFRHYLYEWLGVDKIELSVMTELLLRGPQTEGELRGRASRMDSIADLTALRNILVSLKARGLVVALTPEGRGHVVTHGLYSSKEMEQLKVQYGQRALAAYSDEAGMVPAQRAADRAAGTPVTAPAPSSALPAPLRDSNVHEALRREVDELRNQVTELRRQVEDLSGEHERFRAELNDLNSSLGG